jgi:hypothetical protein
MIGTMRIGIGLPAAVPGADMAQIGPFAAQDLDQVERLSQALSHTAVP